MKRLEILLREGGNLSNFGGKKAPPFKKEEGSESDYSLNTEEPGWKGAESEITRAVRTFASTVRSAKKYLTDNSKVSIGHAVEVYLDNI